MAIKKISTWKYKFLFLFILLLVTSLISSQLSYSNPSLPKLISNLQTCSGTDKVSSVKITNSGLEITCSSDDVSGGGGGGLAADGTYLYNDSSTIFFNATLAGTNLSVNSSDSWDNLDTPSDITGLDSSNIDDIYLSNAGGETGIGNYLFEAISGFGILFIDATENRVGIGTLDPGTLLDVDGNASVNRLTLDRGVQSSYIEKGAVQDKGMTFYTVGSPQLTIEELGDVGIGTTTPTEKLEVIGNVLIATTTGGNLTIKGSGVDSVLLNSTVNLILSGTEIELEDDIGETMRIVGGKVGIGTTTPGSTLSVNGDVVVGSASRQASTFPGLEINATGVDSGLTISNDSTHAFYVTFETDGVAHIKTHGGNNDLSLMNDGGSVGIGTTSPGYKLEVNGNVGLDNTLFVNESGNVGIGTSSPASRFHARVATGTNDFVGLFQAGGESNDVHLALTTGFEGSDFRKTAIVAEGQGTWSRADIHFVLNNDADTSDYVLGTDTKMIIRRSGNVGIGTTTPTHTLNVLGDLNVTGTSYLGNIVISADNISVNNILSVDGNGILFWDNVDLQTNNFTIDTSTFFVNSDTNRVGIGTTNPTEALDLNGGNLITSATITAGTFVADALLQIASTMEHIGDVDTEMVFADDKITLTAGNIPFISIIQAAQNILVLNENSFDVDFRIESDANTHAFFLQGNNGNIGIGTATPTHVLNVVGDQNLTGNLTLGEEITFSFGEIIDNIVNGWITITGSLNVTGNVTADFFKGDGSELTGISGGGNGTGTGIIEFSSGANDMTADNLFFGVAKGDSSEAEVRINWPFSITVTGIHCNQGLAGGSDRAGFTLRDDGSDTTITCTTSAGSPTCSQTGQSVSVAGGSLIAIAYEEVATATAGHASCMVTYTED